MTTTNHSTTYGPATIAYDDHYQLWIVSRTTFDASYTDRDGKTITNLSGRQLCGSYTFRENAQERADTINAEGAPAPEPVAPANLADGIDEIRAAFASDADCITYLMHAYINDANNAKKAYIFFAACRQLAANDADELIAFAHEQIDAKHGVIVAPAIKPEGATAPEPEPIHWTKTASGYAPNCTLGQHVDGLAHSIQNGRTSIEEATAEMMELMTHNSWTDAERAEMRAMLVAETDTYDEARRLFETSYQNVMGAQPSRETAIKERAAIVAKLQVQAKHLAVPAALVPILNGQAYAYAAIIEQTA